MIMRVIRQVTGPSRGRGLKVFKFRFISRAGSCDRAGPRAPAAYVTAAAAPGRALAPGQPAPARGCSMLAVLVILRG